VPRAVPEGKGEHAGILACSRPLPDGANRIEALMNGETPLQSVERCARLYRRGFFCPAVLWHHIVGSLTEGDAPIVLDALPGDLQKVLRDAYHERPASLRMNDNDESICRAIEAWCGRDSL
jgi:hypothetical protein